MDVFWDAVGGETGFDGKGSEFSRKAYKLMSGNYRTVFDVAKKEGRLPVEYCCTQLVTDYICGMTDTFACMLHRQLMNG
jgi:dGTPase